MSTIPTPQEAQTALVERLFGATVGALELFSVHLGTTLGLYDALESPAARRPSSPAAPASTSATRASGSSSRPWPA